MKSLRACDGCLPEGWSTELCCVLGWRCCKDQHLPLVAAQSSSQEGIFPLFVLPERLKCHCVTSAAPGHRLSSTSSPLSMSVAHCSCFLGEFSAVHVSYLMPEHLLGFGAMHVSSPV